MFVTDPRHDLKNTHRNVSARKSLAVPVVCLRFGPDSQPWIVITMTMIEITCDEMRLSSRKNI